MDYEFVVFLYNTFCHFWIVRLYSLPSVYTVYWLVSLCCASPFCLVLFWVERSYSGYFTTILKLLGGIPLI